jgi:hypothetical protein
MTLQQNLARAGAIKFPSHALIDGKLVAAKSGKTFDNVGPRDGKIVSKVAAVDAEDIDAAVKAARAAFEDGRWRNKHPREKKKIMFKLAELMERDLEELAFLETLDMGKPIRDARGFDIGAAIGTVRWYAEALDKIYGEVAVTPADRLSYVVREPLGVVGAIVVEGDEVNRVRGESVRALPLLCCRGHGDIRRIGEADEKEMRIDVIQFGQVVQVSETVRILIEGAEPRRRGRRTTVSGAEIAVRLRIDSSREERDKPWQPNPTPNSTSVRCRGYRAKSTRRSRAASQTSWSLSRASSRARSSSPS